MYVHNLIQKHLTTKERKRDVLLFMHMSDFCLFSISQIQRAKGHWYLRVLADGTLCLHGPHPQGNAPTSSIFHEKYGLLSASFRTISCHRSEI